MTSPSCPPSRLAPDPRRERHPRSAASSTGCERERGLALRRLRRAAPLVGRRTWTGSGRRSAEFFGGALRDAADERVLGRREMPGAEWFPGATLNYAEHARRRPEDADEVAVLALLADPRPGGADLGQLRDQVARARAGLRRLGVGRGDRVVAYLPNIPETLVAFLATASLGAIWASCAPEFGARSVVDRFGQIEPTVLLAVAGYGYGDKDIDRREQVAEIRAGLPTAASTSCTCPTAPNALPDARRLGRAARRARRARVRAGAVRAPAVRAVLLRHHRQAEGDRARPRRDPARAPEEPRPQLGPARRATGSCGSPPPPG